VTELGILEWFECGEHERVEQVCALLRRTGIRHLRSGVSWADWHRPDGPEWYGWLLPRLASEFELLPCVHHTPPSRGIKPAVQSPPRRTRDYADFVDQLIDGHGDLFGHIELWNEPNNLNDWDWRADPGWERFAALVVDASYWAQQCGKKVVLGGMSPTDPNWLRLVAARGALEFVDVVGVHAFPGGWTTGWDGWRAEIESVRAVLDGQEVWVTETGYSTWRDDEPGQVAALADALDAPAERVYWYGAQDLQPTRAACDGYHVDPRHYHYGLVRSNGAPKLLARALAGGGTPLVRRLARLRCERPLRRGVTLVTGGAGFVGTNLAHRLLAQGKRVRVLDNLSRDGVERNLLWLQSAHPDLLEIELGDVRDPVAVERAVRDVEAVFHFAAQTAVTTSLVDPADDFRVNVEGSIRLLEALRRLPNAPPILFTSTNKVYGALADVELDRSHDRWEPVDPLLRAAGISESRPLDFCTPYGCSKGAADQYVLDYAKSFGLPSVVFRMSCIYGPHQHGTEDQGWVAHFVIQALEGRTITLYGDGAQVRDILFVDDLVDAMVAAIGGESGAAYNVGGGPDNAVSLLELLDLIGGLHGRRPRVCFDGERPGDQRYYVSDASRLREAIGWEPRVGVEEGLTALYRWLAQARRPARAVASA
jgi:CDP-paratose 2-epimerase